MAFEAPIYHFDNILDTYGFTITSEAAGYPKENLVDFRPWTYWMPTSTATQYLVVDKGAAGISTDCLSILGHDLFTQGAHIEVQQDTVSNFTSPTTLVTDFAVASNDPTMVVFASAGTERYIRIIISNLSAACYIAVIFLGEKMVIPVGPEFGYDPDRQKIEAEKFLSYTGQFLSSSIRFSERRVMIEYRNIAQSFVASDLLAFLEDHYGAMKPFFLAPDPGNVYGTDKIYYLSAPEHPELRMPTTRFNIEKRNWTFIGEGVKQT